MILVMIILKFTGEGEVFYLQKRLGYLNNEFKILKCLFLCPKNNSKGKILSANK